MEQIRFIVLTTGERKAQLELLVRTMKEHLGFQQVYGIYSKGEDFKREVIEAMDRRYTCFLVDDIVWINGIDHRTWQRFKSWPHVMCLSLRMHFGITYSYTKDIKLTPPKIYHGNVWCWVDEPSYWGYPMSVDGHIFRTAEIKPLIESLEFGNPNELEGQMTAKPLNKSWMMCQDRPSIVNTPLNKVQTVCNNRSADYSIESMNELFDLGSRLKVPEFEKLNSCHIEIEPEWM